MATGDPYVYDKAKYHYEFIEDAGLPEEHSKNHAVPILRWLIENSLASDFFAKEGRKHLGQYKRGEISIHDLYDSWDCCLISDMLSDEGNAFAREYFDFQDGQYIQDYIATLQGDLPTELHVTYTEAGYAKLRTVIDERYASWRTDRATTPAPSLPTPWWRFWKR